jgi:hypothetical protein
MINDFDIWDYRNIIVPTVVVSFALPEEKDFQVRTVEGGSIVPFVEIYDEAVTVTARRRVFIF